MKQVKILSGVSGSGKSTYATNLQNENEADMRGTYYCTIFSADNYFMIDGEYRFDPAKLGEAHAKCFREYIETLNADTTWCDLVIVDNTNATVAEIAPYVLGAQAYGWDVEIITLMCGSEDDVKVCAARNSHGASLSSVLAQHKQLCERELMPWWKSSVVLIEG